LFYLVGAAVRWLRALPSGAELEPVAHEAPALTAGESYLQAVGRTRNDLGLLVVERERVTRAPPPKATLMGQVRPFVDALAKRAQPRLVIERGKPFEAQFMDDRRDFGPSDSFIAGMAAWADPDGFAKRLEAMIEQLPDVGALSDAAHAKKLAELDGEIERLGRVEESLIEAAYSQGVDIVRRAQADPACVLGVRAAVRQHALRAAE
jgi:hypothetical protein